MTCSLHRCFSTSLTLRTTRCFICMNRNTMAPAKVNSNNYTIIHLQYIKHYSLTQRQNEHKITREWTLIHSNIMHSECTHQELSFEWSWIDAFKYIDSNTGSIFLYKVLNFDKTFQLQCRNKGWLVKKRQAL